MIESDFYARLTSDQANLLGTRVYPLAAPQPTPATPLVIYNVKGEDNTYDLDGMDDLCAVVFQVDIYGRTYEEAKRASKRVKTSLKRWLDPEAHSFVNATDMIDTTVTPHLYRVMQEWVFWIREEEQA